MPLQQYDTSSVLYIVGISNALVGVFSAGVFTIAYTSAKEAYRKRRNEANIETTITKRPIKMNHIQFSYDTLAISWVNGLSLFGAFWIPIVFSFVVHASRLFYCMVTWRYLQSFVYTTITWNYGV